MAAAFSSTLEKLSGEVSILTLKSNVYSYIEKQCLFFNKKNWYGTATDFTLSIFSLKVVAI